MAEDESDDNLYIRPTAKKIKTTQVAVTDFFGKAEPFEATKEAATRKPSGSKPTAEEESGERCRGGPDL